MCAARNIRQCRWEKAYHILMEYWDSMPDEEKEDIDRRLTEIGV
jgi:hypothetical protein